MRRFLSSLLLVRREASSYETLEVGERGCPVGTPIFPPSPRTVVTTRKGLGVSGEPPELRHVEAGYSVKSGKAAAGCEGTRMTDRGWSATHGRSSN